MRLKLVALLSCVLLSLGFAQDSIKVGVISSFTGRFAEFGDQHKAGFQVALEEINANGGINGVPLELVIEDDTSDQKAALSSAEKLAQAGLPMVLGAYSSSITNPLAQYFTREQLPFVVFTSSADSITNPGSDWVYRINQPAATYAEILFDVFDYLRSEGQDINNVAVVHGNGTFENAVAIASQELALTRGYRIVELQSYDKGLTDFRPILNRFKSKNPDVILMVSYSEDAVAIVRQVKELGVAPKVMVGAAAGFALPSFIEGAQDAAEGVITATAWTAEVNYEGAQDLYERLVAAKGGEPSYHAAQAYAGLITAADVLRRSSDMSPESIRQA
ncbi:MAG: ABC transporter substrate-binding protein [Deinococcales bacterium]